MAPSRRVCEHDRADPQACTGYGLGKLNFTWKVTHFSKRNDRRILSRNFPADEPAKFGWYLMVYPNEAGPDHENCEYVGCLLHSVKAGRDTIFFVTVKLSLCNSRGHELCSPQLFNCALPEGRGIGNKRFAKRTDLLAQLRNDELVVHADLSYSLSVVQYAGRVGALHCVSETMPAMSLVNDISSAFLDERHSDVVVCVEDKEIPAHKIILSARSKVFAAMLGHHTMENQTNRIEIIDFSYSTIYEMLKFLYQGDLKLDPSTVAELLKVADKYDLSDMKAYISNHLVTAVNSENVVQLAVLADKYNCPTLCNQIARFITENRSSFDVEKNKIDLVKCPLVLYETVSILLRGTGQSSSGYLLPSNSDAYVGAARRSAESGDGASCFPIPCIPAFLSMGSLPQEQSGGCLPTIGPPA